MGSIFPRTVCVILLIASGITLWRTLRRRAPMSRGLPRDGLLRGVLLIVIMSAWIALLEPVGFVAAGIAAYFALAIVTQRGPLTWGRLLRFVLVAVTFVVAFQLIFVLGLKVQLPPGTLFR
jgi:hypothetical protein